MRHPLGAHSASEYDLRGLHLTALIEEPEFARWQLAVTQALEFMRYQIDAGTRTSDFMEVARARSDAEAGMRAICVRGRRVRVRRASFRRRSVRGRPSRRWP